MIQSCACLAFENLYNFQNFLCVQKYALNFMQLKYLQRMYIVQEFNFLFFPKHKESQLMSQLMSSWYTKNSNANMITVEVESERSFYFHHFRCTTSATFSLFITIISSLFLLLSGRKYFCHPFARVTHDISTRFPYM